MNIYTISLIKQARQVSRCCHRLQYSYSSQNAFFSTSGKSFLKPSDFLSNQSVNNVNATPVAKKEDNLIKSFIKKVGWLDYNRTRLKLGGYMLYETIIDQINYEEWFTYFKLSDTFFSWFVITELHLWILMVRCMAEGQDGRHLRNCVVEAFWSDASTRAKKIEFATSKKVRQSMNALSEQFQAAVVGYDEGLLTNDMVLACAIWRRFYEKSMDDAVLIEDLVKYIRHQIHTLEEISREDFFERPNIVWTPLKDLKK